MTEFDTHDRPRASAHARKGIYILPNLFTTASLFSGFYALVHANQGFFESASLAIFIAMVLDGLDGRVARMTDTATDFGKEYDSLADVICFGLAPAFLMYEWALKGYGKIGWLCAFFYMAATALRLARFNTQNVTDKRYFQGLPCPAAAACAAAWVWAFHSFGIAGVVLNVATLVLTVILSLAMVSNVRYNSFKEFDLRNKVPFVFLIFVVMAFVAVFSDPPRILFVIFFGYLLSGPIRSVIGHRRRRARSGIAVESASREGQAPPGDPPQGDTDGKDQH